MIIIKLMGSGGELGRREIKAKESDPGHYIKIREAVIDLASECVLAIDDTIVITSDGE